MAAVQKKTLKIWLVDEKKHNMKCFVEDGKRIVVLPQTDTEVYKLWVQTLYAGGLWEHELFKHVFCFQRTIDGVTYRYFMGFTQRLPVP
jgi:hypothetical protein